VDRVVEVRAQEAQAMARQLAREGGLFVGISAGAAVVAALLPDGGFKYAGAPFWAERDSQSLRVW
jgi:cysteine synthase